LAAVWDAVGVNVPLLPCVAPATLSHTAASATRGLEADTASDACQDSGITAHPAARVSLLKTAYGLIHGWRRFSTFHCLLSYTKILPYRAVHILMCHVSLLTCFTSSIQYCRLKNVSFFPFVV